MDQLPEFDDVVQAFYQKRKRKARYPVRPYSDFDRACAARALVDARRWFAERLAPAEPWTTLTIEAGRDRSERAA